MRSRWLVPCLAFALVACKQPDHAAPPENAQEWSDVGVDFGPVVIGTTAKRTLALKNPENAELRLNALERDAASDPAFDVTFEPSTIPAGGTANVLIEFKPTREGAVEATFTVTAQGDNQHRAVIHVAGMGVDGGVNLEDTVDFGTTALGDDRTRELVIENPSDLPFRISVTGISGDAGFAFTNFAPGETSLDSRASLAIPLRFAPTYCGSFTATFTVTTPTGALRTITLRGTAVFEAIAMDPAALDFGCVNPGGRAVRTASLRNQTTYPVNVAILPVQNGQDAVFSAETIESSFMLAAGESRAVSASFAPTQLGFFTGDLTFSTDSKSQPNADIQLAGHGGGPALDVADSLHFGRVAVDGYRILRLAISNTGTDVAGTTDDNLMFGEWRTPGGWTPRAPEIVGGDGEFVLEPVTVPGGIRAREWFDARIRFAPKSAGAKHARLVLYTNDPAHQTAEVALDGEGVVMPPCSLVATPTVRGFGTVEPSRELVLPVVLRNTGTTECRITDIELAEGTSTAFSLVNGRIDEVMLAGGAELRVPVRYAPAATGTHVGTLGFYSSDTNAPERKIALGGEAAARCLFATPAGLHLGALGATCATQTSTVTLYNTCATAVTINQVVLTPESSSAFSLAPAPNLPVTVAPGLTFEVRIAYQPTAPGDHDGALLVSSSASPSGDLFLAFDAHKPATSTWTDVFTQVAKTDLLFVVDDSAGTDTLQLNVANTASAVLLAGEHDDFHVAVTTTSIDRAHGGSNDNTDPDENGRFVPLAGSTPRIITPNTPQPAQLLRQNLIVGQTGNFDEVLIRPAYLALSHPNVTGSNAGFLRSDANLAVVIISEAADKDLTPLAWYEAWFNALKPYGRTVAVHGLIPTLPTPPNGGASCGGYDESGAGFSTRVRELISRTGGSVEEVCGDIPAAMQRIAGRVFGPRTTFRLSNPIDAAGGVDVRINYQPYPQTGPLGEQRWHVDYASNAVVFDPAHAPEAGEIVSFTYSPGCR